MLVISYSDFSSNMDRYLKEAESSGLKILPLKSEKKLSARQQKFVKAIEDASGIIPLELDLEKTKEESILKGC